VPAPVLAAVPGASAASGAALFARMCAPCHGAGGKGDGPEAARLPMAPTDLTGAGFLCVSTAGAPPAPTDADLDAALDRGAHRGRPEIAALGAAARRSLLLHEKTLAARPALPVLAVPAETPDTPEDRARGRTLYLALGCWRCHGPDGRGDGDLVKNLAWNGRPLPPTLAPLGRAGLCGDAPDRLYLTFALGLGGAPAIMPRHLELAELLSRPRGAPAAYAHGLEGKVAPDEAERLRGFYAALPERKQVLALAPADRQARAAAFLWSLVHHVRAQAAAGP
jgi:mono/diheme cytochrome c family protein